MYSYLSLYLFYIFSICQSTGVRPCSVKNALVLLKGLLPKEYVVAHKTGTGGTLPDGAVSAINDAGIIVLPGGRRMAVTVFVMNSKDSPAVCEGTIASVARWLCTEWPEALRSERPGRDMF